MNPEQGPHGPSQCWFKGVAQDNGSPAPYCNKCDVPLFGIPEEKWLRLPIEKREEGHRLAKELLAVCRRLGLE